MNVTGPKNATRHRHLWLTTKRSSAGTRDVLARLVQCRATRCRIPVEGASCHTPNAVPVHHPAMRTQLPKYRVQKLAGPTHSSFLAGIELWSGGCAAGWYAPVAYGGVLAVGAPFCELTAEAKSSEQATILNFRAFIPFSCATCYQTAHDVTIGSCSGMIKERVRCAPCPTAARTSRKRSCLPNRYQAEIKSHFGALLMCIRIAQSSHDGRQHAPCGQRKIRCPGWRG